MPVTDTGEAHMDIESTQVETLHEGWSSLSAVTIRSTDGRTIRRLVEDHGTVATVLPYDPARKCAILVRQFRAPPFLTSGDPDTLEAIAGVIDEGDAELCARREAMEEAGLALGALEPVATLWSTPGISTERMHLFLAPYSESDRIGDGGGLAEEHEDITVVEMGLAELARLAEDGGLNDMKTFALLQTLRLRQPELFGGAGRS